jgi:hypothetical protein
MSPSLSDTPALSRRGLLKFSLGASAFLATAGLGASLSGCSSSIPASGFSSLRSGDLLFLRALMPVMLEGAVAVEGMSDAVDGTLKSLDYNLDHLSPEMLKLTRQLFDVLGMAVTRGPLTGIWGSWENASGAEIRHFLDRWENSSWACCAWAQLVAATGDDGLVRPSRGRIAAIPAADGLKSSRKPPQHIKNKREPEDARTRSVPRRPGPWLENLQRLTTDPGPDPRSRRGDHRQRRRRRHHGRNPQRRRLQSAADRRRPAQDQQRLQAA